MRWTHTLVLALLGACFVPVDAEPGAAGPAGGGNAVQESAEQKTMNESVMRRLAPTCASCHGDGSNQPFFVSLDAFESLLVFDPRWVTPGSPSTSELLRLLQGQGTGAFKQMPLSGDTFASLAAAGKTQIDLAELGAWIEKLDGNVEIADTGSEGTVLQRLDAEHVAEAVRTQLGLDDADFWQLDTQGVPVEARIDAYPMRAPDALPMNASALGHSNSPGAAWSRYTALGGPDRLSRVRARSELSPTFALTFVQSSQAWCALAVAKPDSVILGEVGLQQTSTESSAAIRANVSRLYLRMIGEPATEADVDDLYAHVYLAYETQSVQLAWTATCAALLRHPLWLTY